MRIVVCDSLENQFQSGFSQRTVSGKPRIRDWNPNSLRNVLYKEERKLTVNSEPLLLQAASPVLPLSLTEQGDGEPPLPRPHEDVIILSSHEM